jgi:hypothetical protein
MCTLYFSGSRLMAYNSSKLRTPANILNFKINQILQNQRPKTLNQIATCDFTKMTFLRSNTSVSGYPIVYPIFLRKTPTPYKCVSRGLYWPIFFCYEFGSASPPTQIINEYEPCTPLTLVARSSQPHLTRVTHTTPGFKIEFF